MKMRVVPDISVSDAANRLGVNPSRVRALIQSGLLDAEKVGHRWLVDSASVERRSRSSMPAGAPLRPDNAWAIILMKAGESVGWLSPSGRYYAKRRLKEVKADELVARLERRAKLQRFRAHQSDLPRIMASPEIVLGGVSAALFYGFDISALGIVEAYIPSGKLPRFLRRYRLQPSRNPNVLLRVVEGRWPFPSSERVVPAVVAAIDLMESDDPRSRRAGKELFGRYWLRSFSPENTG